MRTAAAALFLLFLCVSSLAGDTLKMRSGETKKGKVLAETETQLLFRRDSDGLVTEVQRSEISIMDLDPASHPLHKGSVGFYSEAPDTRKPAKAQQKRGVTPAKKLDGQDQAKQAHDQGWAGNKLGKKVMEWVKGRPGMATLIQEAENSVREHDKQMEEAQKILESSAP